jgi:hypothetical protein
MKKPKLKLFKLEGYSIGFGYHLMAFHLMFLRWLLILEFKK